MTVMRVTDVGMNPHGCARIQQRAAVGPPSQDATREEPEFELAGMDFLKTSCS